MTFFGAVNTILIVLCVATIFLFVVCLKYYRDLSNKLPEGYVKPPTKKSCEDCAKLYDEELNECPKCGCKMFWVVYMIESDLFDDEPQEDPTFSFKLDLTISGDSTVGIYDPFAPIDEKDFDWVA